MPISTHVGSNWLQVTAVGAKSFVCQYRAGRRSRRLAIKANLELGEARKEARAILGAVAKGRDPLAERRKKEAEAENTLQSVCESYFAREGKNLRTVRDRQTTLTPDRGRSALRHNAIARPHRRWKRACNGESHPRLFEKNPKLARRTI